MATDDMEVTINLTPLGHDEGQNHRAIILHGDKKEVEIGRASKNANKGLLSAFDNAWFDYPILSRAHAKFTVSLPQKTIYVQDCGSTHGTYLQKTKLDRGVEYAVRDGEVITFGQRVTSGAVTYPAKEFRVYSEWESRTHASAACLFNQGTTSTFQVPDDDNDSSFDSSREGSVQILDSHPRSYSVPSTDSESDSEDSEVESIEIASSVQDEKEKDSAATTPEHGIALKEPSLVDLDRDSGVDSSQSKTRDLNLKGPSIVNVLSKPPSAMSAATGSSQHNAIDLEDDESHNHNTPDTESDEEGPEHLPIQQVSSMRDQSSPWDEPPLAAQQYPLPTLADKERDLENGDQVQRIILETQARIARDKKKEPERRPSPQLPLDSTIGASDGFESADDDGFDVDDDFSYGSEDDDNDLPDNLASPNHDKGLLLPKLIVASDPQKPQTTCLDSGIELPKAFRPSSLNVSVSDGVNVSQNPYKEFSPQQRAPSPSDAALAKNSFDVPPGAIAFDSYGNHVPGVHHTLPYNAQGADQSVFDHTPFGYQYHHPMSYPDLPSSDTHSKPYDQGPFTSHYHAELPSSWASPGDILVYKQEKVGGPTFPRSHDIAADARYAAKLQAEEDAYVSAAHQSFKTSDPSTLTSKSRNGSEGQSSKINISSLVNASHIEDPRPLKRKANEISTAPETEEALDTLETTKSTRIQGFQQPLLQTTSDSHPLQETQLPEAQARDSLPYVETASLTQDSVLVPVVDSVSISHTTKNAEVEGPARKKARTSSSSSRGIGKFVSGVCVGLVGAFAAFVATIPASVREEALRELGNAT